MKNKFLIGALSVMGSQICWATIEIAGTFVYRGGANPLTTNFAIRIVGYALSATDLFFNPSDDYIVHT